ncbi:MAG: DEAD/DEAH box helicase family protein, partial [Polyangiaceae bacterium]
MSPSPRRIRMPDQPCPFCSISSDRVVWSSDLVVAVRDLHPVSRGHTLLVPRRHVATYFDATAHEQSEIWGAIDTIRLALDATHRPDAYSVGFDAGVAAGQTVAHAHVHVIPRYVDDTHDPRGGVRGVIPSKQKYDAQSLLSDPSTTPDFGGFLGGSEQHLLPALLQAMAAADRIDILSAFVQPSGFLLLRDHLRDALARGAQVRLLTGDYLGITSADALREIYAMCQSHGLSAWVYVCGPRESFHPKSYIFGRDDGGVAFVGSSNISATALQSGVEWNLRTVPSSDQRIFREICGRFDHLLRAPNSRPLTPEWIASYAERVAVPPAPEPRLAAPEPNDPQRAALKALDLARAEGSKRGLVVLATGLGKTYLAAFDARAIGAGRILFIAHREEILMQARDAWARVFPERIVGMLTSDSSAGDILFASIQTLSRAEHLQRFAPDAFDYIVIDEFHHAAASTYRKVLAYFQPRFLLGLTATPDRMDGASLHALCDDNVVYRKDLVGGIAARLLVPFRYYGVKDAVDFAPIPWRSGKFDSEELTKAVATEQRAEQALEAYTAHATQFPRRTLAFCVSVVHADFMADFFRRKGVRAVAVHSGPTSAGRADSLAKLANGEIEVLCAVDVFNEGLDVPTINTVLMLRPTESPVIFLQQIGRGLRTAQGKSHLTIVDFIGNHRSFLQKPQAILSLTGRPIPPFAALREIKNGSLDLPEGCHVDIELEAIEMLERLCRPGSEDILVLKYVELRDAHGRRPTAAELFAAHVSLRALDARDDTWFDFVKRQGDLTPPETIVLEAHRAWLRDVQRTRMNRSYKMIALRALLDLDRLRLSTSVAQVAAASLRLLRSRPLFVAERVDGSDGDIRDEATFARAWRTLPLAVWANGEGTAQRWFSLEGELFKSRFDVSDADADLFDSMTEELVDYRLRQYEDRLRSAGTSVLAPSVLKVSHASGRPILRFDRSKQPNVPVGPTTVRVDGTPYIFDFAKIAVNKVTGADPTSNELPALMRAWFGPHAGQPGTRNDVLLER